jgi:hypothetical protein
MRKSWRSGFNLLRLLLVAMPLLAGVYDAYDATSRDSKHEPVIAWSITFVEKLATRLPLTLILAFVVYGLVSVVGSVLWRLHGMSIAAQAARHAVERPGPPNKLSSVTASRFFRKNGIRHHHC